MDWTSTIIEEYKTLTTNIQNDRKEVRFMFKFSIVGIAAIGAYGLNQENSFLSGIIFIYILPFFSYFIIASCLNTLIRIAQYNYKLSQVEKKVEKHFKTQNPLLIKKKKSPLTFFRWKRVKGELTDKKGLTNYSALAYVLYFFLFGLVIFSSIVFGTFIMDTHNIIKLLPGLINNKRLLLMTAKSKEFILPLVSMIFFVIACILSLLTLKRIRALWER